MLLGPDGVRLSKRHRGVTLRELRDRGASPEGTIGRLAHLLGIRPEPGPVSAGDLVDGFRLAKTGHFLPPGWRRIRTIRIKWLQDPDLAGIIVLRGSSPWKPACRNTPQMMRSFVSV